MAGSQGFLVLDACVLIDYLEADSSVLAVIRDYLAPIYVVRPVFDEIANLTEADVEELKLEIVDPDLALASAAVGGRGTLSFADRLCLLLAAREKWICVTNDAALRKACQEEKVEVRWGLELLLDLVRAGGLGKRESRAIASAIHQQNPHYVNSNILSRFEKKLSTV